MMITDKVVAKIKEFAGKENKESSSYSAKSKSTNSCKKSSCKGKNSCKGKK